jgi:hypothetical protein
MRGNDVEAKENLGSCVGIIFFGVPNGGLDTTSLQSLVERAANQHFPKDLHPGSDFLYDLTSDFYKWHRKMETCMIITVYETEKTKTVEVKQ